MTTEKNRASDEAQIRQMIDGFVEAFRAKDINGVVAIYAPEIVSFDLAPPLQYVGAAAYRKVFQEAMDSFQGQFDFEVRDLNITTGSDVAYSYSFNRMGGTMKNGRKLDLWLRWTACFQKINGKWLIMHEQVSVPVDLESGNAVLDLKP